MDAKRANMPENRPESPSDQRAMNARSARDTPSDQTTPQKSYAAEAHASGGEELAPGVRVPDAVLRWSYASASGPGGQNVNRRATKAVLRLTISQLPITPGARSRLCTLAKGWLVHDDDELVIASDEHRSQARNRAACLDRLRELLVRAMVQPKRRIATKPGRGAKERRLRAKREQSEKKQRRGNKPDQD